ncbi:MAG TPA: hypothetical protein VKQ70_05170 [Caulobacteraceae bacterium]|nr:hypothetical protein [Caulobacteraceae bacterium]
MPDQKKIDRVLLMLDHVERTLKTDPPDLRIAEKLLSDALNLMLELVEPPNPYADPKLRPGLTVGEAAARGMISPPEGG